MEKGVKIFLWVLFTVLFGLSPLAVKYLNSRTSEHPAPITELLKMGDLFIVSAVIAADAIGKALSASHAMPEKKDLIYHAKRLMRIICACACILLLYVTSVE